MLKPLQQWICDVCGKVIEKPELGYVIWKEDNQSRDYDFKVIHQAKCDLKEYRNSLPVKDFLGECGLTKILSFLSVGPIKKNFGDPGGPDVKDIDEFVDLVRRFQISYYEEARQKFSYSDVISQMSDANEYSPYLPDTLEEIASIS